MKIIKIVLLILLISSFGYGQNVQVKSNGDLFLESLAIDSSTNIQDVIEIIKENPKEILISNKEKEIIRNGFQRDNYYIFDNAGIVVIVDGVSNRIYEFELYFKQPNWSSNYTPSSLFTGNLIMDNRVFKISEMNSKAAKERINRNYKSGLELMLNQTSSTQPYHSLTINPHLNDTNEMGWTYRKKAIFRQLYSEDANYAEFCRLNKVYKTEFIDCLIENISERIRFENYQSNQVDRETIDKIVDNCIRMNVKK